MDTHRGFQRTDGVFVSMAGSAFLAFSTPTRIYSDLHKSGNTLLLLAEEERRQQEREDNTNT